MKITINLDGIEGEDVDLSIRKHTVLQCDDCQVGYEILKNGVKVDEKIYERREFNAQNFAWHVKDAVLDKVKSAFNDELTIKVCELLGVEIPEEKETPQEETPEMVEA